MLGSESSELGWLEDCKLARELMLGSEFSELGWLARLEDAVSVTVVKTAFGGFLSTETPSRSEVSRSNCIRGMVLPIMWESE